MTTKKTWKRCRDGRWIAGICSGLARRLDWRVSAIRTVWLIGAVIPILPGLPVYLVLWLILPWDDEKSSAGSASVR